MAGKSSVMNLKWVVGPDFWRLMVVCLKMLFRKSTRKRFICLVAVFIFTMGVNTCSYIRKFHDSETRKTAVLEEKAFKIFFLRQRTPHDYARFIDAHRKNLERLDATVVRWAFLYQNNLYIHVFSDLDKDILRPFPDRDAVDLFYQVFGLEQTARRYLSAGAAHAHATGFRNRYVDYNGIGLDRETVSGRQLALKGDLTDAADLIRGNLSGGRMSVFNDLARRVTGTLQRTAADDNRGPNAYLSRVGLIVPMNLLHLFRNLRDDNTTDIVDFKGSVRETGDSVLETDSVYLQVPAAYRSTQMYGDVALYPRYIALYAPNLLGVRWNWLLYEDIRINTGFMDAIERLHFRGHYLFSYEKAQMIRNRTQTINHDMRADHFDFYLTDLSIGIAFPFMISLFSFIHLKTEMAFLLMFKNRIRELLAIFWLLPLLLMLLVKGGAAAVYLMSPMVGFCRSPVTWQILLPMTVSYLVVSAVFYPMNRWCFSQFTGGNLTLSALHKGR